jgi:hypothetical protein
MPVVGKVTGSFAATGTSPDSFLPGVEGPGVPRQFNISLTGSGVATIQLERSFDQGQTWCPIYGGGAQLYLWTYSGTNLSEVAEEVEPGVLYRLNDTNHTSGTVAYRISQ